MAQEVACPRCGTRREWSGNPFRPFCSERCKLIDLGGWLSGENAIAGESADVAGGDSPLQRNDRNHLYVAALKGTVPFVPSLRVRCRRACRGPSRGRPT